ncbi:MAG: hypothetical protein IKT58_06710 [Oscillospiraceae bacterium]|nr:hypothetical protein [Oscillospiraceae bacterium]
MKKINLLLSVILILCLLAACADSKSETSTLAESYRISARRFISSGDLEGAKDTLLEGIDLTDSDELKDMLEDLLEDMEAQATTGNEDPSTAEPGKEDDDSVTPSPEASEASPTEAIAETVTEAPTEVPTEAPTESTTVAHPEILPVNPSYGTADAVIGDDISANFSTDDRYKINVFLSNFSEQGFGDLDLNDKYSLIQYVYKFTLINQYSNLSYDNSTYSYIMSTTHTDKMMKRFFGRTISHGSVSKTYSSGYTETIPYDAQGYHFRASAGENYPYFTVVDEMYHLEFDGTYLVYFKVYSLDLDLYFENNGIAYKYYCMTDSQASSTGEITYCYSGCAEVKDYDGGTFQSYQLLSYTLD